MASREEMKKEAVERMEILGLSKEEIIDPFARRGKVTVTEQKFTGLKLENDGGKDVVRDEGNFYFIKGMLFEIDTVAADELTLKIVKDIEKEFNYLIYHIFKVYRTQTSDPASNVIYGYMGVSSSEEDWYSERDNFRFGLTYAFTPQPGFPKDDVSLFSYESCPIVWNPPYGNLAVCW